MQKTFDQIFIYIFAIVFMVIILGAFWAFVVMLLWNATLPYFGIPQIDFWHAWGIWILSNLLLKSYNVQSTYNKT